MTLLRLLAAPFHGPLIWSPPPMTPELHDVPLTDYPTPCASWATARQHLRRLGPGAAAFRGEGGFLFVVGREDAARLEAAGHVPAEPPAAPHFPPRFGAACP